MIERFRSRPRAPRARGRLGRGIAVGSALLLVAVGDAMPAPGAHGAPPEATGSFESRCEALPPGRLEVSAASVEFSEDYGKSTRALSLMSANTAGRHRTVGLTRGRLGYELTLESHGLEDRPRGRACARPSVQLVFSATPVTIYVAREWADDDCRRGAIRSHELKHVAVYEDYLGELATTARARLAALYEPGIVYARSAGGAQRALRDRLRAFMRTFMAASQSELEARQAAVDTSDEYARLERRCGPPQG